MSTLGAGTSAGAGKLAEYDARNMTLRGGAEQSMVVPMIFGLCRLPGRTTLLITD